METTAVFEQVQRVAAVRTAGSSDRGSLEDGLRAISRVEAWLAGAKAAITTQLAAVTSFPEQAIADCTRGSTRDAIKERERASTLDRVPSLAGALDNAAVTAGHVDAFINATNGLDDDQRDEIDLAA